MDYFSENYEEDYINYDTVKTKKWSLKNYKLLIIIGVLVIVFLVFFAVYNNSNNRYGRMEKDLINAAKSYVDENYIIIDQEIYLDVAKLNYSLSDECSRASGVFYDGFNYRAYLLCGKYQSNIIDNSNNDIKLKGNSVMILVKGMTFIDPGYSSNYDIDVTGDVGTEEGVYNLHYYSKSNTTFLTRKVVIIDNESLYDYFPSISLIGDEVIDVIVGESYEDQGIIAVDDIDGDISKNVIISGDIDVNTPGEYKRIYTVTNSNGYSSSIVRMINVVSKDTNIDIHYLITPQTIVNTNVNITMRISGNGYDYTLLPDNTRTNDSYINYQVEKNGVYKFNIYDKNGNITEKEVEINNIDKVLPTGTCDAIIYDNYAEIVVNTLSMKNISSYNYIINNSIEKKQLSSMYHHNSPSISSAKVTLYDSVGNTNTINCEVMNYISWKANFAKTNVYIESMEGNDIIKKYTLEDYLKGVIYASLGDIDYTSYTDSQLSNLFKTYFIVKKSEVFYSGKYDVSSKELIYRINNANYCDVYSGCKLVNKNNKNFYLANDIELSVDATFNSKEPLGEDILRKMSNAYNETKKNILVYDNYNEVLTKYPIASANLIDRHKDSILSEIQSNTSYSGIIQKYFSGYKIYNIDNYSSQFESTLKLRYKYWWPIGSSYSNNGIYEGYPESVNIVHNYGASLKNNKIYDYLAIKGECNKTKVISIWNGTVISKGVNNEYGNHVIVDYGSGIKVIYGSLANGSIMVNVGSRVNKGELIGTIDKTDNECMLYFKVLLNDQIVNPNDYISASNVRPTFGDKIIVVEGPTVKETVCLSLLESGFSIDAVAAIMANIQRESNFSLRSISDGGTSVGLIQWHNERWEKLNSYCNNNIYNVECQLNYMMYELKTGYKSVYSYIIGNYSAYDIAYKFCYSYEVPAAKETSCFKRGDLARDTYVSYVSNGCR